MPSFNNPALICDLHCHSIYSHDSFLTVESLIRDCGRKGINCIAITDHDCIGISGEEEAQIEKGGIACIVGCEISTDRGAHIIGLFIRSLPESRDAGSIADHIIAQNGLIVIPHPFKDSTGFLRQYQENPSCIEYVLERASFIELYNGNYKLPSERQKIRDLASRFGLRLIAASDAHKSWEVGRLVTTFNSPGPDSPIRSQLLTGEIEMYATAQPQADTGRMRRRIDDFKLGPHYAYIVGLIPAYIKKTIKLIIYKYKYDQYQQMCIDIGPQEAIKIQRLE